MYPMRVHLFDEFRSSHLGSAAKQLLYEPRLHCCDWSFGYTLESEHADTALLTNAWKGWGYADTPYIEWASLDGSWGLLSRDDTVVIWGELSILLAAKQPSAFSDGWLQQLEGSPNPLTYKSFRHIPKELKKRF